VQPGAARRACQRNKQPGLQSTCPRALDRLHDLHNLSRNNRACPDYWRGAVSCSSACGRFIAELARPCYNDSTFVCIELRMP
jgi:hypothetical protein